MKFAAVAPARPGRRYARPRVTVPFLRPAPPSAHAAAGDCERVRPGWIGQPVNTATSLAYVAAAAVVARSAAPRRSAWVVVLVWLGLGSVGYHGPGNRAGKVVHDCSLLALVALAGTGIGRPHRHGLAAAALTGVAAAVHGATRTGRSRCEPDRVVQGHGVWHLMSAAAVALFAAGEGARQ